ncbi:MAG: trypsin-like peptidase domain-containing protein [Actinomycetota bacterium]
MKRPVRFVIALALSIPLGALPSGAQTGAPAAAPDCHPIAVPARSTAPLGTVTCTGVRPGALVQTPVGFCTENFLFKGSDGYRYIGTAGHCILSDPNATVPLAGANLGERVWALGKGPVAKDAAGHRIGLFAYAVVSEPKDFALIRLDKNVPASAAMCFFGGPSGVNATGSGVNVLHYYGNGTSLNPLIDTRNSFADLSETLPARTAISTETDSPDHVYAWGLVVPGDSGGPLIDDNGRALGVIVTTGEHAGDNVMDTGLMGATRLMPQLRRAASALRLRTMTLMTAAY